METRTSPGFTQRHPFLFGFLMIILAVALIAGATAFFAPERRGGIADRFASERIGVVEVYGTIERSEDITDWIAGLRDDDTVKGVLLHVDSPGGTIAPSQEIYQAVKDLAAVKPVVASYSTVAASGGYYASCPATVIVANPGSMTASIGVKVEYLNLKGLAEKLGVTQVQLVSGKNKGSGSPFADLAPEQREALMSVIMDMHDQFVTDVAAARDLPKEEVAAIADGRVLSGRQALDAGLVDMLGTREQAIAKLKELCGLADRDVPVLYPPREAPPLLDMILGAVGVKPGTSIGLGSRLRITYEQ